MLGAQVPGAEPLRFLRGVGEHALGFAGKRDIDLFSDAVSPDRAFFDLLSNRLHIGVRSMEKSVGQVFIFPQQTEQNVFGLDLRGSKLIGLVTSEEDHAARFFCISFKHSVLGEPKRTSWPNRSPGRRRPGKMTQKARKSQSSK